VIAAGQLRLRQSTDSSSRNSLGQPIPGPSIVQPFSAVTLGFSTVWQFMTVMQTVDALSLGQFVLHFQLTKASYNNGRSVRDFVLQETISNALARGRDVFLVYRIRYGATT
jgi:hypothetical protein